MAGYDNPIGSSLYIFSEKQCWQKKNHGHAEIKIHEPIPKGYFWIDEICGKEKENAKQQPDDLFEP